MMGVALFGSLIAQKARFLHGLHAALFVSGLLALVGCCLGLLI